MNLKISLKYFWNLNYEKNMRKLGFLIIFSLILLSIAYWILPSYLDYPYRTQTGEILLLFFLIFIISIFYGIINNPFVSFNSEEYEIYSKIKKIPISYALSESYSFSGTIKESFSETIIKLQKLLENLNINYKTKYKRGYFVRPRVHTNACLIESDELAFEIGKGNHGRTYLTIHVANKETYEKIKSHFKLEKMGFKDKLILAIKT